MLRVERRRRIPFDFQRTSLAGLDLESATSSGLGRAPLPHCNAGPHPGTTWNYKTGGIIHQLIEQPGHAVPCPTMSAELCVPNSGVATNGLGGAMYRGPPAQGGLNPDPKPDYFRSPFSLLMLGKPRAWCLVLVSSVFIHFTQILKTVEHEQPTSHAVSETRVPNVWVFTICPLSNSLKTAAFPLTRIPELRRLEQAESEAVHRAAETPEQSQARRRRHAEYLASQRAAETTEQSQARRRRHAEYLASQRAAETTDKARRRRHAEYLASQGLLRQPSQAHVTSC
ncbi:hypothetical protein TNCV_1114261 [Trichonephila clavipes]|nr:hypothetical protein TNCV_1114261 [Trichonephila clavipes]